MSPVIIRKKQSCCGGASTHHPEKGSCCNSTTAPEQKEASCDCDSQTAKPAKEPCCSASAESANTAVTCGCSSEAKKTAPETCASKATAKEPEYSCGCGSSSAATIDYVRPSFQTGTISTPAGEIPRISTELTTCDRYGTFKARWDINRMAYAVAPGLYGIGNPTPESPVLVTANYKLTFDRVRKQLAGRNLWLMVLDSKGINVWCAAGKGTFGTAELVNRITVTRLSEIVSHRRLILPQLGAPGVSGYQVFEQSGFHVQFGPVRSEDLPTYLDSNYKVTPEMRRVRFGLKDRIVLIPVELVGGFNQASLIAIGAMLLVTVLAGFLTPGGFTLPHLLATAIPAICIVLGSFVGGSVLGPILLPILPGRRFSMKGAILGMLIAAVIGLGTGWMQTPGEHWAQLVAAGLISAAITSYTVLNFTGSSTFTSLSGVLKETRQALPLQLGASVTGLVVWIVGMWIA